MLWYGGDEYEGMGGGYTMVAGKLSDPDGSEAILENDCLDSVGVAPKTSAPHYH